MFRTTAHGFSDLVLCVEHHNWNPTLNWATKLQDLWGPNAHPEQNDITGRPIEFEWHVYSGATAPEIRHHIQEFLGDIEAKEFERRSVFMSMFTDID